MPFLQKDQVSLVFNGSGILAEEASITSRTSLAPAYVINRASVVAQTPRSPIQSEISFSYPVEGNDPIFSHVSYLRTADQYFNFTPQSIIYSNISGEYYLTRYEMRVSPNKIIKAAATFISYNYLSGRFGEKSSSLNYNMLGGTGLLHANTALVDSYGYYLSEPIYELNYSFSANWIPVYSVGSGTIPVQINLAGGKETFTATKNYYTGITLTGAYATGSWKTNSNSLIFKELSYSINGTSYDNFVLDLTNSQHTETRVEEQDGLIKSVMIAENYF